VNRGACIADTLLSSSFRPKATSQDAALYADWHAVCGYGAAGKRISVVAFDSMLEEPSTKFDSLLAASIASNRCCLRGRLQFSFENVPHAHERRGVEDRDAARAMGAITVVHGSDSTDNPRMFLENGFDYVLCGEAEESLVRLCRSILNAEEVPELTEWSDSTSMAPVRSSQRLSKNPAWSELPLPARDLIDMEPYRAWVNAHGYFSTNMVSSRGCPYSCNWCAKPISGNKFHLRSAAAVAEEMRLLKESAGVQHIWFGDDVFALDRHWVQRFAEEVTKRDAAVPFKIQSRADLMSEANCPAT
jgi:anaerobic magnesium-protoporphyrin IX monomethyl ester cyclase